MISTELQADIDTQLVSDIFQAQDTLAEPGSPVLGTELGRDAVLSERYEADIWFAGELHQAIGAYKIRGAYNFLQNLTPEQRELEIVASSAGNHGQAIALVTSQQGLVSRVFMPEGTPEQKVQGVKRHGGSTTRVTLGGSTYDASQALAMDYCKATGAVFAHPFNDRTVIAGQGTLGLEITQKLPDLDAVLCPVGGSGLLAGLATAVKHHNPDIEVVGVEPAGAASMQAALLHDRPIPLQPDIDTFVDGAAVRQVGELSFAIARPLLSELLTVANPDLRRATTDLWERGVPVELAGALSVAGLGKTAQNLKGKTVVCILSGGNLSQERYEADVRLVT